MSAIPVRPYRVVDAAATMAVFRNAVHEGTARDYTAEQRDAWAPEDLDEEAWALRRSDRPTWVAEIENAVVGFIDLMLDGHIDMLFVHTRFHRQGVASALYRTVEDGARDAGIGALSTDASLTAQPFFARCGFEVVERQSVARRGQRLENARMEKHLSRMR